MPENLRIAAGLSKDYYALLELPRDASLEEINAAARLQRVAWDPRNFDRQDWKFLASERQELIEQAWECLKDPEDRRRYDRLLAGVAEGEFKVAAFLKPGQERPAAWKRLATWLKKRDKGTPFQRKIAFTAGDYMERRRQPTEKQLPHMLNVWELGVKEGFDAQESD